LREEEQLCDKIIKAPTFDVKAAEELINKIAVRQEQIEKFKQVGIEINNNK